MDNRPRVTNAERARRRRSLQNAAARGAAWLDDTMPGWSRKIRRRKLDVASPCNCVLGQLDGGADEEAFFRMADRLGLSERDECRLGFNLAIYAPDRIDLLNEAWLAELRRRPR